MKDDRVFPLDPAVPETHEGAPFVERLRASLGAAGEGAGVLAVLKSGPRHGLFIDRESGARVLATLLGGQDFCRLRSVLARVPCHCCDCGCENCPSCDGTGATEDLRVCRPCAGFGKTRCDFCGGTGLAPYEVFPGGLGLEVARGRVALAISRSARLRPPDGTGPGQTYARAVQHVLNLNKLLGVFENARAEVQNWLEDPSWGRAASSLVAATDSAAQNNFRFLHLWLENLVALLERQHGARATALTLGRVEFYRSLLETGDLKGTLLDHPFLNATLTAPAPARESVLN